MIKHMICPDGVSWQWQEAIEKMNIAIDELRKEQGDSSRELSWDKVVMEAGEEALDEIMDVALGVLFRPQCMFLSSKGDVEKAEEQAENEIIEMFESGRLGQSDPESFAWFALAAVRGSRVVIQEKIISQKDEIDHLRKRHTAVSVNNIVDALSKNIEARKKAVSESARSAHKQRKKTILFDAIKKEVKLKWDVLEKGGRYKTSFGYEMELEYDEKIKSSTIKAWCREWEGAK